MNQISIVEKTNEYVVVRIPRRLAGNLGVSQSQLTGAEALRILQKGLREARAGKTKTLRSLKDLRA